MTLPLTNTVLSTAVACVGTFLASNGRIYGFGRHVSTATTLRVSKCNNDDPGAVGAGWDTFDQTGFATAIAGLAGYPAGDVIHLCIGDGAAGSNNIKYQTFNMSSDSFVTALTIASGLATAGQTGSDQQQCSIVVRSNGNDMAFFNGAQTKKSGTNYARVYWSVRIAGTFSAPAQVDDGGATDNIAPEAVLGASDRVHFFWKGANGTNTRTITAGNSLGTANAAGINGLFYSGVSYDDAGTQKICALSNATTTGGDSHVYTYDSADSPTLTDTTIDNGVGNRSVPLALFVDGTDLYAIHLNTTNSDLVGKKSTDNGANWGSDIAIMTATVGAAVANLSRDGSIYQRGSSVVIPYIVNDNGTLKYNEYVVRTLVDSSNYGWLRDGDPFRANDVIAKRDFHTLVYQ